MWVEACDAKCSRESLTHTLERKRVSKRVGGSELQKRGSPLVVLLSRAPYPLAWGLSSNCICIRSVTYPGNGGQMLKMYFLFYPSSIYRWIVGEMPSISPRSLVQNGWYLRFTASKNRLNLKGGKSGAHRPLSVNGLWDFAYTLNTPRLNKMDGFDHGESAENVRPITFYFIFYLRSHLL